MKIGLVILLFVVSVYFNCSSQDRSSDEKVFKTKQKYVFGYSSQFPSLTLGIFFQKNINAKDTIYYIRFLLTTSISDEKKYIYLDKNNSVTFTSKTGKSNTLLIDQKIKFDESDPHSNNQFSVSASFFYTANVNVKVTKEELLQIGSESFHHLMFTYNDALAKTMRIASFGSPNFYTRRSFLQKDIKHLLEL